MKRLFFLLMLLLTGITGAIAQTGELYGIVYNETNQPVAAAQVKAERSGILKATTTSARSGRYDIKNLEPGNYVLRVSCAGYKIAVINNVQVFAGKKTRINAVLTSNVPAAKELVVANETVHADYAPPAPAQKSLYTAPAGRYNLAQSYGYATSPGMVSERMPRQYYNPGTESYRKNSENDFMSVKANPLSTMSVDVDRASYSNIRRFINEGQRPPADAVRIEEMINYFNYSYPRPAGTDPIAIVTETTDCPWNPAHKLLHIGMQARRIDMEKLPPSNIVFLIDVSGSMDEPNKLPLLQSAFKMLTDNLRAQDRVSIVVYAGNAGLVLPSTPGNRKQVIREAIDQLQAGGSTAGGEGIRLAYKTALEHFIKGGNNRVILATDGDFNVGLSGDNELEELIVKEREKGIFLTCLGFGMGNYKDSKMEVLADKGNGNYAYIDNIREAQKTLVSEFGGTLFTVAKDVKSQIEFNPARVQSYRLIGYENRLLNEEDFKDDKKDAGDMGSGHSVTILYEIVPAGTIEENTRNVAPLKYQQAQRTDAAASGELATVKFRYKQPDGNKSREMVHVVRANTIPIARCTADTRFSAAVALFGMMLKDSKFKGRAGSYETVLLLANSSRSEDKEGYRAEFIRLVKSTQRLVSMK